MTYISPARWLAGIDSLAQKARLRGWSAVALLLVLACLGLTRPGGAGTPTPSKTPTPAQAVPSQAPIQGHMWGTVRTVQSALAVVVATPELAHIAVRLLGVEPPVVPPAAHDGTKPTPPQPYGWQAETYLRDLLQDKQVVLDLYGKDRKGRILGVVWLGDINVNLTLVKQGLAWMSPSIPVIRVRVELEVAERQAQVGKYGLWALPDPEPPWEFRKRHGLPPE
jgi:endonuclease YncB( thermonuclease family)